MDYTVDYVCDPTLDGSKMKWINRDFQPPPPYVCLVKDAKTFRRQCIRVGCKEIPLYPDTSAARTWFMHNGTGGLCAFVCLNMAKIKGHNRTEVYCLLVHEAVHVCQEWMDDIGEDKPGKEQEAYAIQWISAKLINAWEEIK